VKRGEIYWADMPPPSGRRPLLVLSRSKAIPFLTSVVVAEVSSTIRDIPSEVRLGKREGLPKPCVASMDSIHTVPKEALDDEATGELPSRRFRELDDALRFTLDVR